MNTRIPADEPNGIPTEADWQRAEGSLDRHVAKAARSPRFAQTLTEITERQATLSELRRAFQLSQVTLAETLDMSQSELSRLERRSDLLLSTLQRFVAATGGSLRLIANYPDRAPVELRLAALAGPGGVDDVDGQTSRRPHQPTTRTRKQAVPVALRVRQQSASKGAKEVVLLRGGPIQAGTVTGRSTPAKKPTRTSVAALAGGKGAAGTAAKPRTG